MAYTWEAWDGDEEMFYYTDLDRLHANGYDFDPQDDGTYYASVFQGIEAPGSDVWIVEFSGENIAPWDNRTRFATEQEAKHFVEVAQRLNPRSGAI